MYKKLLPVGVVVLACAAPTQAQVERVVDWAAVFHGTWWEDPHLQDLRRSKVSLDWLTEIADRHVAAISDHLSTVELARTRRVHQAIPHLWALGTIGPPPARAYALIHGDLHLWNVLYPIASTGSLAVVDWEEWDVGHPMTEIAYLVGLNWDRSRNPADERALIERYHAALVATGRPAYSWEDCWRDYRRGIIALFRVPAVFHERKLDAGVWWPHVRRIHAAYEQLDCDELLTDLR